MVERTDRTIAISELGQDPIDRSQVDLVDLSIKQTDALTVLMTGRGEANFADLIKKIVKSKNLVFDMICLKPQVGPSNQTFLSTMKYKQAVLRDLIYTYKDADEIKVYEDRPKQSVTYNLKLLLPLTVLQYQRISRILRRYQQGITELAQAASTETDHC